MLASELLNHWPAADWQPRRLLVGVSGGADSVGLLCALREVVAADRLVAAHYNHGWRGAASNADEAFVVHLCQQLGVECVIGHAHRGAPAGTITSAVREDQNDSEASVNSAMLAKMRPIASESRASDLKSEETARKARYQFFITEAYQSGASYVVTAHTADDRAETLLHNLFRGAGLAGAASLRTFRELDKDLVLVRPLLAKWRSEVLQYLSARGQTYCIDASNDNEQYARNYIRNRILPAIRQRFVDADANLVNFSQLTEEALKDTRVLAERWLAATQADWNILLDSPAYASNATMAGWRAHRFWGALAASAGEQPWTIVREALRLLWLERGWPLGEMSRRHWESVRDFMASAAESPALDPQASGPRTLAMLPGGLAIETAGGYLAIGLRSAPPST